MEVCVSIRLFAHLAPFLIAASTMVVSCSEDPSEDGGPGDSGASNPDARGDADTSVRMDAAPDVGLDTGVAPDAPGEDAAGEDAAEDAGGATLVSIEATPASITLN